MDRIIALDPQVREDADLLIDLVQNPPVEIPDDIERVIRARLRGRDRSTITNPVEAREILKMMAVLLPRADVNLNAWDLRLTR